MNFDYLAKINDFQKLYSYCKSAEDFVYTNPILSATSSRQGMEYVVKFLYSQLLGNYAYASSVFEMITDVRFVNYINNTDMINAMHDIRRIGNCAVHGDDIGKDESLFALEALHYIVGEFAFGCGYIDKIEDFKVPGEESKQEKVADNTKVEEKVIDKKEVVVEEEILAKYYSKLKDTRFDFSLHRDENKNKEMFMKATLREAGWPITLRNNTSLPSSACINMMIDSSDEADYTLNGRDNRPLAIIEIIKPGQTPFDARTNVIRKAKKLENKYGYAPTAYYTNGYQTYCIDTLGYPPRRVFQFHTLEELEMYKNRSSIRKDISNPEIDDAITNRKYQKEAILAVCDAFNHKRRRALIVMATGTGKTRVSISLVDILMKANWAKNVLFLADRTSLVRQAHKNFNKLLPSVTTSIYTGGSTNRDKNARIIFSTYQTMIGLINDDTKEFGIGRFDLIIIDEAHRSIFKKYGALFNYFDSLMIGLTATPRNEENKSTYQVFNLPNGKPDYAYELETAIAEKYLVGFAVLDKTTDKLKRGIRYDDLSPEDKEKYEDAYNEEEGVTVNPKNLKNVTFNLDKKTINIGTIKVMLNDLMNNGLKVDGGDKLGKTIIFAKSHVEAEVIVETFQKVYSTYGLDFCKLVDSKVEDSYEIIDQFTERDKMPQIAVSVDMLDTGIDVPDILNLVFFKTVRSKTKFLQMIGRGTRLSKDIFGAGEDKKGFQIFDYYDNCRFFSLHNTWTTVSQYIKKKTFYSYMKEFSNITSEIYNERLELLEKLQNHLNNSAFDIQYEEEIRNDFVDTTQSLSNDNVSVEYNMSYVSKYRTKEMWLGLSNSTTKEIKDKIIPLFPPINDASKIKLFDYYMFAFENSLFINEDVIDPKQKKKNKISINRGMTISQTQITPRAKELLKQRHIPAILKKEATLSKLRDPAYLTQIFTLENAEKIRHDIRDLMNYLPDKETKYTIIDIDDKLNDSGTIPTEFAKSYEEKLKEYLQDQNVIIAKIMNLDELSESEKNELSTVLTSTLGSKEDFQKLAKGVPMLPFVRSLVGITDQAISTKFGHFLNNNVLNNEQLTIANQIIDYARANGDITMMDLQKVSPFSDIDFSEVFNFNINYVKDLINGLHKPVI